MTALRRAATATSLTGILLVLACNQPGESPVPERPVTASDLDGSEWIVSSLNDRPLIAGSNITLSFDAKSVGGYDACNWYGSYYTMTDSTVKFESVEATARVCGSPAGVMRQEAAYHATLRAVAAIRIVGERLVMADRAGADILTAVPRIRSAMNPVDLVGTAWRLRSVNDSATADSSMTLTLTTAGELTGFAGCRAYTGTYLARGDHVSVTSIAMTTTECNDRGAAALREGRFTTNLSEASYYRLTEDTLEMVTAPGHRLLFARARALREDVVGEWEKIEQTLPPIHLRLWLDRDTLRARLRLSGRELHGTATFNGTDVQVDLGQPGERLTGVLVKAGELEVRLPPGSTAYRLRKRNLRR